MIRYHGTPINPVEMARAVLTSRHAMISYSDTRQVALAAEVCQSFVLDNGAFTTWKTGQTFDHEGYYGFVEDWCLHPGFDWALIPDIIDGNEDANDSLIDEWPFDPHTGVPVWHLHESLSRLRRLADSWARVAIGSSGEYATIGTSGWWARMGDASQAAQRDADRAHQYP